MRARPELLRTSRLPRLAAGRRVLVVRWSIFQTGLVAVVIMAAILRLWAIDFGVPLVAHPDEEPIVRQATRIIDERDPNPHWFRYPSFIIYVEAVVIVLVRGIGELTGMTADQIKTASYLGGRLIVAASGVATVALVGLLGRRLATGRRELTGLLAAALLAVSFIHAKDSHYLKPDVPSAFFATLTLWFTLDALERDRRRSWFFAGFAVGLASTAKYNAVFAGLVPTAALIWQAAGSGAWVRRWQSAATLLFGAIAGYLLFSPYSLLTPAEFLSAENGIVAEWRHYRSGHEGAEGADSWRWYLVETAHRGFASTLTPFLAVGLVAELVRLWRRERSTVLLLVFPLLYFIFISRYPVRFDRQLIPILPFLALIAARWVGDVPMRLRQPLARIALIAVLVAAFLVPLARMLQWNVETARIDTRYPALTWLQAELPSGSVVAREWYTPPLDGTSLREAPMRSAFEQPLAWFEARAVQYLVISSFMFERYLDEPGNYPAQATFYRDLLSCPAIAQFEPDSRYSGPAVLIYRFEDVVQVFERRT